MISQLCFGASPPCICDVGLKTNLGPSAVAAAVIYKAHFRLCTQRGMPRIANRDRHSSIHIITYIIYIRIMGKHVSSGTFFNLERYIFIYTFNSIQ